jgi:RNA polymerase sigma-70 factor, ECF subfamily
MSASDHPDHEFGDVEAMIVAARRGEQSQLDSLLRLYRGYLLTIAAERLGQDAVVKMRPSDLVQETLLEATQGFAKFHGTTELQLRVWLQQILNRQAIDARRYWEADKRDATREVPLHHDSEANGAELGLAADSATPAESAETAEERQRVSAALQKLEPKYREVIHCRMFEQLEFEEIGTRFGISTEAARKLWTRALRMLAEEMPGDDS